jgi:excisionase family DNA binding protein
MKSQKNDTEKTLAIVLFRLAEIEKKINSKSEVEGEYLTPKEVCKILKIGRSKFYSWVADGYITPFKPDPKGRKTYVHRTEISKMFPEKF